jgi:hypothetical protein
MSEQKFLVFSNPTAGKDAEYNAWYDDVHLGDVKRVPGVTGAVRYELAPTGGPDAPAPAHRYLAVYDLDPKVDPAEVLGELMKRAGGPEMTMSEALDLSTISMSVWRPRG